MIFPTDNLIWVMPTEGQSVYGVTRMRFFILKGKNIMNITPRQMLLYAVSDRAWSRDDEEFTAQVRQAVMSGVTVFQLREKQADYEQFKRIALSIKPICKEYGVPLIINDNVKLAKEIDADGVHLGQDDLDITSAREYLGQDKIIGVSAHNVAEALAAQQGGADYLGSGAAFVTSTKTDAGAIDRKVLADIAHTVKIPVVAIGGINAENITQLQNLGLDGVAVVSAIFAAEDIPCAVRELKAKAELVAQSSVKQKG